MQGRSLFRPWIFGSHSEAHQAEETWDGIVFYRVAPVFLWVVAISKDGCGLAAVWGKIPVCVDVPHSAVIKQWNSPFKSAEETRMKSLVPTSIVRGAWLDDVSLPDCRVYFFFFTTLEDPSTLKGLREGGWRGWNHLDVQRCRFKAPSPRARRTQCICLTSSLLLGFTLRIAPAPRTAERPPCARIRLLLTFRGKQQKFPFSFTALSLSA